MSKFSSLKGPLSAARAALLGTKEVSPLAALKASPAPPPAPLPVVQPARREFLKRSAVNALSTGVDMSPLGALTQIGRNPAATAALKSAAPKVAKTAAKMALTPLDSAASKGIVWMLDEQGALADEAANIWSGLRKHFKATLSPAEYDEMNNAYGALKAFEAGELDSLDSAAPALQDLLHEHIGKLPPDLVASKTKFFDSDAMKSPERRKQWLDSVIQDASLGSQDAEAYNATLGRLNSVGKEPALLEGRATRPARPLQPHPIDPQQLELMRKQYGTAAADALQSAGVHPQWWDAALASHRVGFATSPKNAEALARFEEANRSRIKTSPQDYVPGAGFKTVYSVLGDEIGAGKLPAELGFDAAPLEDFLSTQTRRERWHKPVGDWRYEPPAQ